MYLIISVDTSDDDNATSGDDATAAFCLTLPGETLYLTPLLNSKKFRNRGNKDGAIRAFLQLEEESLGKTLILGGSKGTAQVICMYIPSNYSNSASYHGIYKNQDTYIYKSTCMYSHV